MYKYMHTYMGVMCMPAYGISLHELHAVCSDALTAMNADACIQLLDAGVAAHVYLHIYIYIYILSSYIVPRNISYDDIRLQI